MIYSKFGTPLSLVSKHQVGTGPLSIQARAGDTPEVREYSIVELKADDGLAEIDRVIAGLPWKVIVGRRSQRVPQARVWTAKG